MAQEDLRDTGERLGKTLNIDVLREAGVDLIPAADRVAPAWGVHTNEPKAKKDGNFLSNVVGLDSPIAGIHRMFEDAGAEYDPNFHISDLSEKEWQFYSKGISEDRLIGLASAGSKSHLEALAVRLRSQETAEAELSHYGGWGVAGRLGVNLLDPVGLAVGAATGGLGALTKAERLARAAQALRAAGKLDDARVAVLGLESLAKATPWQNAARMGAVAGVENMGFAAVTNYGDPSRDAWDIAQAGLFGAVLGAGFTRVFNGREMTRVRTAFMRERQALDLAELEAHISVKREEITARLAAEEHAPDVAHAQDALKALERDITSAATARKVHLATVVEKPRGLPVDAPVHERAAAANESSAARVELNRIARAEKEAAHPSTMLDEPTATKFAARQASANDALAKALGLQATRKAAIETELKGLDEVRAVGVRQSDKLAENTATGFGMDSLSAAKFNGFDEGLHPHLEGAESGLPVVGKMALAGAVRMGPLATMSGTLRGSNSEVVRNALGRLVGNAIGNADGSANAVGASEIASRLSDTKTAMFYSGTEPQYVDWAQRNGFGIYDRQLRPVREKFMVELGLHIRGQVSQDPAIAKAAAKVQQVFKDFLKEAKDAGVKGFENVDPNGSYLPRVFNFTAVHNLEKQIGSDNLRLLVRKAIQTSNEDLDDTIAGKIADAYVRRMKELRVGSDVGLMQGMAWDDVGFLRRFMGEAGTPADEIEEVVTKFAALNAERKRQMATTEGSFRNAKHRVQFDENFEMQFRDQNESLKGRYVDVPIKMSDLFENNVEALYGRYSRSVSGHVGLAKIGIKSRADFDDAIKLVERDLNGDLRELKRVKDTAEVAYKIITGAPIEDTTTLTRLGRAARDYNFATVMGQSGWAQVPDFHGLLVKGYLGYTLSTFFDSLKTFKRVDGSIDDEFYREMEEVIGVGTDFHNNAVFSSYDPGEESLAGLPTSSKIGAMADNAFGKVEHALRVSGRGVQVASGLAFMTSFAQRLASRGIVQRLLKEVTEGGAFSKSRVLALGLSKEMKPRIEAQLRKHTLFVDGDFGGKVKVVNYAKWDDVDARDAFMYAVYREGRRIVQEEDLGDTSVWMHKNWGKIILQFRRFGLVSYTKQMLYGIAHHDAEAATGLMLSMTLAAMAYKARHETAVAIRGAAGADQEELDAYREKYLAPDRLAAAAWANSSYASLTPALIDTTATFATGQRFFDTRSSGQGSDLITGNPTYSLLTSASKAGSGTVQAMLRGDRQFDQTDAKAWRRLLPYQNVLGMDAMFQALTDGLPKKDEDPDPENVDWMMQN